MEIDRFKDMTGQVVPALDGKSSFVVIKHLPVYARKTYDGRNEIESGTFTMSRGFFSSMNEVLAVKQSVKGFFYKKIVNRKGIFDLYKETNLRQVDLTDSDLEKSLLIKITDEFPYEVDSLVDEKVVLSMEYIDSLRFKVSLSKAIGEDDLKIYTGEKSCIPGRDRIGISSTYTFILSNWKNKFRNDLSVKEEIVFSANTFEVISRHKLSSA